ncbi:MAG: hypothetical protein GJ677_02275 [Rhodobacteraceae bacterium]|nr:hypothetical protein [Paracoccaceae bacterium]
MSARLIDLLLRLAPRERRLLALLVLVILPVGIWGLWLQPLQSKQAAVQAAEAEARALRSWVAEQASAQRAFPSGVSAVERVPQPPIGLSGVEQSLVSAGLREAVSDLGTGANGAVELRFGTVEFTRLMGWLSAAERDWGYQIDSFRIEAHMAEGLVSALFRLTPEQAG